ncbi:MAG: efflux RND transporter periplasmic adaptor subunit [Betaproteobacteria bacterium]|nr:efflux RND transporter periplasmic adaptor subunit [Betaproteobacteria bacterium]
MNKAVVALLVVPVILVAAGAGYWFGSVRKVSPAGSESAPGRAPGPAALATAAAGASKGQAPVPVEVTRVGTASLPQTITAVGTLRSDESVTLRPEVAGRITAILFQEGERVAKGATLVRLDPAISTAELQQARANLTLAKSKHDRAVDLAGRTFISGQAKDEAKHSLDIAQAAVALAEAKLAKMELKAPFAGIIGLRVVSIGDYVKEGTDLVNLEAIDPLKVDFRVPETFLIQVQVGQPVKVALDALPGESYDGNVIALNPLVDAAGRAIVIRAQVRNQNTALRPGMFARVTLITRAEKDALVLPEEAFVPQGTEQYVFRVIDGKAARVKVETGQRRDRKVEIVSGVGRGDVVVTAGQSRLRDGAQVRIADTQAGKAAPDASKPSPSASSRSSEGRETAK